MLPIFMFGRFTVAKVFSMTSQRSAKRFTIVDTSIDFLTEPGGFYMRTFLV